MKYVFNRNPVLISEPIAFAYDHCGQVEIEHTPSLDRASFSDALMFGGPLMRRVLETAPVIGDRAHVFVDSKVTFLMPGWWPAIPGWHTDGVPRGVSGDPKVFGAPSLSLQAERDAEDYAASRYHTIVLGVPCLTRFLQGRLELDLRHSEDAGLYSEVTRQVDKLLSVAGRAGMTVPVVSPGVGSWASWDWWNIHSATPSAHTGWRLLVRVVESDTPPKRSGFVRAQNQVYVPTDFGW